jgi:hypothetical protein
MLNSVVCHYSTLIEPSGMLAALQKQHKDPAYLLPAASVAGYPSDVWLFRIVFDLIKAFGGAKQGYGYAQLVQDIKAEVSDGKVLRFVRVATAAPGWSLPTSTEPVRRGLQDYVNRIPNTSFSPQLLAVVAFVLAKRLGGLPKEQLDKVGPALAEIWASSTFEARLLAHRGFDPIGILLKKALAGTSHRESYISACFADAAQNLATKLTGTTKVIIAGRTIINWQSSHGSHTNDKKKELCGRAVGLRYHWNGSKFVLRPDIDNLILVLDGTWRDDDIQALVRAGWDEIYFPDEMDRVIKAIV